LPHKGNNLSDRRLIFKSIGKSARENGRDLELDKALVVVFGGELVAECGGNVDERADLGDDGGWPGQMIGAACKTNAEIGALVQCGVIEIGNLAVGILPNLEAGAKIVIQDVMGVEPTATKGDVGTCDEVSAKVSTAKESGTEGRVGKGGFGRS